MKTWILICDGAHGRLFETPGAVSLIRLVREIEHPQSRNKGSALITDRPGSTAGGGGIHAGMAPRNNPRKVEEEHFAIEVARLLQKGHGENAFERLVLIAPPQFLGRLKGHMTPSVLKLVTKTVDKDLTQLSEHELKKTLERYF